jgi:hypothetical protein
MHIGTLILKTIHEIMTFFYEILYDIVYLIRNSTSYAQSLINKFQCILIYYVSLVKIGVMATKLTYDFLGPNLDGTNGYSVSLGDQIQLKRNGKVLIEGSIPKSNVNIDGMINFIKDVDSGKEITPNCPSNKSSYFKEQHEVAQVQTIRKTPRIKKENI